MSPDPRSGRIASGWSIRYCCSGRSDFGEALGCELVIPAGVAEGGVPCGPCLRGKIVHVVTSFIAGSERETDKANVTVVWERRYRKQVQTALRSLN
jgi:hypothetical protein